MAEIGTSYPAILVQYGNLLCIAGFSANQEYESL